MKPPIVQNVSKRAAIWWGIVAGGLAFLVLFAGLTLLTLHAVERTNATQDELVHSCLSVGDPLRAAILGLEDAQSKQLNGHIDHKTQKALDALRDVPPCEIRFR
jgi:hypothetical protein